MAKGYDASSKTLIHERPLDWLKLAGFPLPTVPNGISIVNADLAIVSPASDKLLRVEAGPDTYLAHFEFQSSADPSLDQRVLLYNVIGRWWHRIPVRSVVILLRKTALSSTVKSGVSEWLSDDANLAFRYRLIRVWELPFDGLLDGPIGTMPLAPIANIRPEQLPGVMAKIGQRLKQVPPVQRPSDVWAATRILLGLRYSDHLVEKLMLNLLDMEESSTYQAIIKKGRQEGHAEGIAAGKIAGERQLLIRLATAKLGTPSRAVLARINAISTLAEIERLGSRIFDANNWKQLLSS